MRESDYLQAHNILNRVVSKGIIKRPDKCPICKQIRKVVAHHDDYSNPLDIKWACYACHKNLYHINHTDFKELVESGIFVYNPKDNSFRIRKVKNM